MTSHINEQVLRDIDAHAKRLRFLYRIKGFGYERAIELPLIASYLSPKFSQPLRYLDIGTGQSIFPSWVAKNSSWDVTCLDKFNWVEKQHEYAAKLGLDKSRYHVVLQDFLEAELEPESFDVITNISVIEHFEGGLDSVAMERAHDFLSRVVSMFLQHLSMRGMLATGSYSRMSTVKNSLRHRSFFNDTMMLLHSRSALLMPQVLRKWNASTLVTTTCRSSTIVSLSSMASRRSVEHCGRSVP